MERATEVFAVAHFLVVGLSHALRPRDWADLFVWLRERGHPGVFVHGLMSLWFGSFVVAFHNVWTGMPAVLTAAGWLYLVKASLCFLLPETQMRSLRRVSRDRAWVFIPVGVVYVVLAALLAYSLWATG